MSKKFRSQVDVRKVESMSGHSRGSLDSLGENEVTSLWGGRVLRGELRSQNNSHLLQAFNWGLAF